MSEKEGVLLKIWEFRTFLKVSDGAEGTPWVPEAPSHIRYCTLSTFVVYYSYFYILTL